MNMKLADLLAILLALIGLGLLIFPPPPVALTWETASEVETAGFNVSRAEAGTTHFEQVNSDLIPARGDEIAGAEYRFIDETAAVGRKYTYRIEEVEWDGAVNAYPETVSTRAGLPRLWSRVEGAGLLGLGSWLLIRRRRSKRE
ncbi:MAG: hypothetical protein GVY30_03725 [Chloroflexi bacterium]|jgi:hypothetical protein|nr:hypothetical protein [Chloroflexota bacterium]